MKVTGINTQSAQVKTVTKGSASNAGNEVAPITYSPDDWICHKAKVTKLMTTGTVR